MGPTVKKPASPEPVRSEASWTGLIKNVVLAEGRSLSYADVKARLRATVLGERLEVSDKGFYTAIGRLHEAKEIVRYKGHLFSPEEFGRFEANLHAGLLEDLRPINPAHRSLMGEAMVAIVRARQGGLKSGNIIWELNKTPEFAEVIQKNKTHPYNVLRRLTDQKKLIKRGDRYYAAENETPPDSTSEGVSNTGGAATPSFERRDAPEFPVADRLNRGSSPR